MLHILLLASVAQLARAARPNVLMISSDSMDGRVLDPDQHIGRSVPMPHLRALAARGTNFVGAYTPSPVCGPSRACALTSRFVSDLGVWNNYQEIASCPSCPGGVDPGCEKLYGLPQCQAWAAQFPVPSDLFKAFVDAGYTVDIIGKVDIGAGVHQRFNSSDPGSDHTGPEARTVPRGAGLLRNSMAWAGWSADTNAPTAWNGDNATTARMVAWLAGRVAEQAAAPSDAPPFFAYAGINIPHPPFATTPEWLALVNRSNIHPPWLGATHPYDVHMTVSKGCAENATTHATRMEVRAVYLAMCAQADAFHGAMMDALGPLANNTIILYWSDHGEMAFEANQVLKDTFREPSARVPLIWAGPGIAAGRTIASPVSLLDIWPTFSELLGLAPPPGARGFSLAPQMAAAAPPSRGDHPGLATGMFFAENSDTGAFMLRSGDLKLLRYGHSFPWFAGYASQLFNVSSDPLETEDLAPAHPALVAQLEAALGAALGVDVDAVDAAVMRNDQFIYREYLMAGKSPAQQRELLQGTYKGFDDADWQKVVLWNATEPTSAGRG